ncbi:MAG: efflux RND transporter periplasmic adaptor subunit [Deltaproteobacteria bacterium]|nr:efflux RND transporter periplasmic adaptor subunit [Deltaproteobacteria bacterium]
MIIKNDYFNTTGKRRFIRYAFLIVIILVVAWFFMRDKKDIPFAPEMGQRPQMQGAPPLVIAQEVVAKEISSSREYIGRIEAVDSVDLIARVSGYLETIDFIEGRNVKAGDLMFTIEKARFKAEIEARRGSVLQIEANLADAEKYLQRLQTAKTGSVPEKDIETAQKNVSFYSAQLVSAKANLELATIDLAYATVRSPITGRVTLKRYSVGDYVGPNSGTIATVIRVDPIRVVCSISEVEYINLLERSGASLEKIFRPSLRLPNGSLYKGDGEWDFIDTSIDPSTGTISMRSRFANPEGILIPGGYVTVILTPVRAEVRPLIPQPAVMESKEGSYVFVVDKENIASMRMIKKRSVLGTDWIIDDGIKAGEVVIVKGIQKVRPGQAVNISGGAAKAAPKTGN